MISVAAKRATNLSFIVWTCH